MTKPYFKNFLMENLPEDQRASLWGLAWVSFLWSFSSLMAFSLLPSFLVDVLHVSKTKVGFLEGTVLSIAFLSKISAGVISDIGGRSRKPLIMIGTIGTALVKPLFALAGSFYWIFAIRFLDRVSKGIRSSPTEALVADLSPPSVQGTSYGLRQTLYVLGATCGGGVASFIMKMSGQNYRLVFALSTIPAALAIWVLYAYVQQPPTRKERILSSFELKNLAELPRKFWFLLGVVFFLMLARFSEAFIIFKAQEVGWLADYTPLLMVCINLVHAAVAYPFGYLADRYPRYWLLLLGFTVLVLTDLVLACASNLWVALIGSLLSGVHLGMTQGLLKTLVAEAAPAHLRGTAFALFYCACGMAVLPGNVIAGTLSDAFRSSSAPFLGGGLFTLCALVGLAYMIRKQETLPLS